MKHATRLSQVVAATAALVVLLLLAIGFPKARADDFDYEFNLPGVLPSSQGATYFGNVPESDVFSVSGGMLHQTQVGGGQSGIYEVIHGLNHHEDATLTWSSRLISWTGGYAGAAVEPFDADPNVYRYWPIGFEADGLYGNVNNQEVRLVAMDTTDRLHSYGLFIPHDSDAFDLYVDGVLRYSGSAYTNPVANNNDGVVQWGEATIHNENAAMDWDFIRMTNHATAVPEPGTCVAALALTCSAGWMFRRRLQLH